MGKVFITKLYRQLALESLFKMSGSNDELACVYAALILADDKVDVTDDKLSAILKAANYTVAPYWSGLFAKALEGCDVVDLITKLGSAPAAGAAAAPAAAAADAPAAAAAPEKKKEKTPEPSS